MSDEIKLKGNYGKTTYRNDNTGFTVFRLIREEADENGNREISCSGRVPIISEGVPVILTGRMAKDKRMHDVFIISPGSGSCIINVTDQGVLIEYIRSCLPKGTNRNAADDIADRLSVMGWTLNDLLSKPNAADYLKSWSSSRNVKGLSPVKASLVINKLIENIERLKLLEELSVYGINAKQIDTMYTQAGRMLRDVLKRDPYTVMNNAGIPFRNIDIYAKKQGLSAYSESRLNELTRETYVKLCENGWSYGSRDDILRVFRSVENTGSGFSQNINEKIALIFLYEGRYGKAIKDGTETRFYNTEAYDAENMIKSELTKRVKLKKALVSQDTVDKFLKEHDAELDEYQKNAVKLLTDNAPSVITGGPGSGKTTTIKRIVECYERESGGKPVMLCAPTGKAAKRIREGSGLNAVTVHSLLGYGKGGGLDHPEKTKDDPLPEGLVIVDEFSMMGIFLFRDLLEALTDGTKLIMVGDPDQLESVEPGSILHDMLSSSMISCAKLLGVHRQGDGSSIITNARNIIQGNSGMVSDYAEGKDAFSAFEEFGDDTELVKRCEELFKKYYDPQKTDSLFIMSPQMTGYAGTKTLNEKMESCLYDETKDPYITCYDQRFFIGSRVMTIRNNNTSDTPYCNGDLWTVKSQEEDYIYLRSDNGTEVRLGPDEYEDIIPAYASTVHKCQGSEADTVIVCLPQDTAGSLISRSLLYTAVTRPRKRLFVLYTGEMLERFINSPVHAPRKSGLKL